MTKDQIVYHCFNCFITITTFLKDNENIYCPVCGEMMEKHDKEQAIEKVIPSLTCYIRIITVKIHNASKGIKYVSVIGADSKSVQINHQLRQMEIAFSWIQDIVSDETGDHL